MGSYKKIFKEENFQDKMESYLDKIGKEFAHKVDGVKEIGKDSIISKKNLDEIEKLYGKKIPEFTQRELSLNNFFSDSKIKTPQFYLVKWNDGKLFLVDNQGYDYMRRVIYVK